METASSRQDVLQTLQRESRYLQEQHGVARIALYGSLAQDTATETRNVDLLVELSRPLGFEFVALAEQIENISGRIEAILRQKGGRQ
jgi:predicted nucleotidyltransferase